MPARDAHRLHPRAPRVVPVLLGLVLLGAALGCGPDDGRTLAEPDPELTAVLPPTTTSPPAAADPPDETPGPGGLALRSPEFAPGGELPPASLCGSRSPALRWSEPPGRIRELALVVQDIDAGNVAQWVVTGIPAERGRVAAGQAPEGADVRANSSAVEAWSGPCPTGSVDHRIVFTLYALDRELPAGPGDAGSVVVAVQAAAAGSASLLAIAPPDDTEPG